MLLHNLSESPEVPPALFLALALCMLYECTIGSYLQDGYILLREPYIKLTLETMQVEPQAILTSRATAFKFTYKARSDVEDLPLPHTHTFTRTHTVTHTHTHTCMYTHMHTHKHLC